MKAETDISTAEALAHIERWRTAKPNGSGGAVVPALDEFRATDMWNAHALVRFHGDKLRYCPPWKTWLHWDDKRWAKDDDGAALRYAADTVRRIYELAAAERDDQRRQTMARHAANSENRQRLEAMVALGRIDPAVIVRPEELDADPWVINVENGLLDLRTGSLSAHDRSKLCSKLVPIPYMVDARPELFFRFLRTITGGNTALMGYLQEWAGYCLTGSTTAQVFDIWYGGGANGKSTLQNIMLDMGGEYAASTASETFTADRQAGQAQNDIAALKGVRLAACYETRKGVRLNEGLVKRATGGDPLTARFLYGEYFTFAPEFKLTLSCNHRPVIRDSTLSIWRRVHLVPFGVTVPERDRDPELPEKLREELPGILRWAIEGARRVARHGLQAPEEVRAATNIYRESSDLVGAFIADECKTGDGFSITAKSLYEAFAAWATENGETKPNGEPNLTRTAFGLDLADRGYQKRKEGTFRYFGITLEAD